MTTRPALTTLSPSEEEAELGKTWVVLNEEEGSSPTLPLGFGKYNIRHLHCPPLLSSTVLHCFDKMSVGVCFSPKLSERPQSNITFNEESEEKYFYLS